MKKYGEKDGYDPGKCERTRLQKEMIIQKLKDRGCRMTKQRLMLLEIILSGECSCCKEIYYRAAGRDAKVGLATVYRMVNTLEEIGAIDRKNMYKVICGSERGTSEVYMVEFDDGTSTRLSADAWFQIVRTGLKECGYMQEGELRSVRAKTCDYADSCDTAPDCESVVKGIDAERKR